MCSKPMVKCVKALRAMNQRLAWALPVKDDGECDPKKGSWCSEISVAPKCAQWDIVVLCLSACPCDRWSEMLQ